MNRNRWPIVLSVVLVLSLALSACAPAATPTPQPKPTTAAAQPTSAPAQPTTAPAPTQAQQPVELRIVWWGSQDRHDRTIKAINLYMQQHPNVKITYEFVSWADYWTKLATQAAGNNLPDIMQQDYAYIVEYTNRNLILPLDDYVKDGTINLNDTTPAEVNGGRVNGKLVAINLGSNSQCWVIDVDAFNKAGVPIPANDWTWADMERTAMQLHEKLGIYGMGAGLWDEQIWGSLYLSNGEWRYNADGTGIGYASDQPYVDHLKMLLRLQKAGAIVPRAEDVANYFGKSVEAQAIVSRKAAMGYIMSNQIVAVQKAAGEDRNLKLLPLPRLTGGKSANYIKPSQFWSIATTSKHPKEAAQFIDWFTNSIEANQILGAERGVPISSKVRDALKPTLSKAQAEMFDYVAQVSKTAQPIPPADPPGHSDIVGNVLYSEVADPVAYGQITPEQGAAIMRQEVNTILAKNKK